MSAKVEKATQLLWGNQQKLLDGQTGIVCSLSTLEAAIETMQQGVVEVKAQTATNGRGIGVNGRKLDGLVETVNSAVGTLQEEITKISQQVSLDLGEAGERIQAQLRGMSATIEAAKQDVLQHSDRHHQSVMQEFHRLQQRYPVLAAAPGNGITRHPQQRYTVLTVASVGEIPQHLCPGKQWQNTQVIGPIGLPTLRALPNGELRALPNGELRALPNDELRALPNDERRVLPNDERRVLPNDERRVLSDDEVD